MNRLLTYSKQAAVEAAQDSWSAATGALNWLGALSLQVKSLAILAFVTTYYGIFAGFSLARSGQKGCGNDSAKEVLDAIGSVASVIMFIVGGLVVLMFMVGGALIVAGGKSSRVQQGFTFLKNALIGLAIVAAALFIQEFVLKVVGAAFTGDTPGCLEDGRKGISSGVS
jgi:hypothetical protein